MQEEGGGGGHNDLIQNFIFSHKHVPQICSPLVYGTYDSGKVLQYERLG